MIPTDKLENKQAVVVLSVLRLSMLLLGGLLAAPSMAAAAELAEVMGMRYLRYELCMERSFGKDFYQRLGIATVINRWGVPEPTTTSLALQPPSVLKADARCRKENELTKEPRPRG